LQGGKREGLRGLERALKGQRFPEKTRKRFGKEGTEQGKGLKGLKGFKKARALPEKPKRVWKEAHVQGRF